MRISELAKMLNVPSKELVTEMEHFRSELLDKGLLLPQAPKPSNRLEDDTAREVLAIFDRRRLEAKKAKEEEDIRLKQEEQERALHEEQERLKREEEERHRQEEQQRRLADLELQRKRQELAAQHQKAAEIAGPRTATLEPSPPPIVPLPPVTPPQEAEVARKETKPRKEKTKEKGKGEKPKLILRQIPVMQEEFEGGRGRRHRGRERGREDEDAAAARRRRVVKGTEADTGKRFRPSRLFGMDDVPRKPVGRPARPRGRAEGGTRRQIFAEPPKPPEPKVARMVGDFTLGEFAERSGIPIADLMRQLLLMGEAVTINQLLNPDLAELLAAEHEVKVEIVREGDELDIAEYVNPDTEDDLQPRPPVVTVMGHVDHGKTTLLDAIRKTNVVDEEHGGITQHIGAYTVSSDRGTITFLDTPGHEAFTAMRARGATMTDIVVLVVAANDGVMPQTIEAINHAKAAEVPIVVAINKVDVPGANSMRVRQDLMQYGMVSEDLGGSTIMAEVSAKKQTGIQELLDLILLQAEVQELKANPNRRAVGTVVESHVDPQRGAIVTLLVQRGTLRPGDIVLAGPEFGRVRAMYDDHGRPMKEAGPSTPVEVLGMNGAPPAGELFVVTEDEAAAREIAEQRVERRRRRGLAQRAAITLESLSQHIEEGKVKDLHLILKADVQGSLEAIAAAIQKLPSTKVRPVIIHSGIGNVAVSDIDLAAASEAVAIGFNVQVDPQARELSEQSGVEIKNYRVIYDLLDELRRAMLGLLEKKYQEAPQATAKVLQVFRSSKFGAVAGCLVETGTVVRGHKARVRRGDEVVHTSEVASLRRVKDDVKQVQAGTECGIGIQGYDDIEQGDVIETFTLEEMAPEL